MWRAYIDRSLGEESNSSLRIRRLVLRKEFKLVILILKVANVPITGSSVSFYTGRVFQRLNLCLPLARQVKTLGTVIPERHTYPRDRIQGVKASDWFFCVPNVPESHLTIAHLREACRCDSVVLAHPHHSTVFRTRMARNFLCGSLLPDVPYSKPLIARGRYQKRSIGVP